MNRLIDVALNRPVVLILAAALMLPPAADARIPEPEHVLYGNARLWGEPAPAGALVSVVLDGQTAPVASYRLGSDPDLGQLYVLRIPMDSLEPRTPGTARQGDGATVYLDGVRAAETTVGDRGTAVRLDVDPTTLVSAYPNLFIDDITVVEKDAYGWPARFTVRASAPSDNLISAGWAIADGTATGGSACPGTGGNPTGSVDYVNLPTTGTVLLQPGETSKAIDVTVCGDPAREGNETFTVTLTNATWARIAFGTGTATIVDNDVRPVLSIAGDSVREPPVGSADARFEVSLAEAWGSDVQVGYTTVAGTATAGDDFTPVADTLTIPAGQRSGTIRVPVLADAVTEPVETFRVALSPATGLELAVASAVASIVDPASSATLGAAGSKVEGSPADGSMGLAGVSSLAFSPDGRHLYAGARTSDAVVLFERVRDTGELQHLVSYTLADAGLEQSLLDGVVDVEVSPDGAFVYAAAYRDDGISVFARDPATGELAFAGAVASSALNGINDMVLAPDGAHLYAVGGLSGALVALQRDFATGLLTEIDVDQSGTGGVQGINGATGVAVSPDGAHVYVTGALDGAVAVFARDGNPSSGGYGNLSFVTSYTNLVGGVEGIGGASAVVVAPDGQHVYVTGQTDNAVGVFARDGASGELQWLDRVSHGETGVAGLRGPQALAVTGDGRYVYAAGLDDHSLVVFERDADAGSGGFGSLSVVENLFDGDPDVLDLAGPVAVTMSRDDVHVYVAAYIDNAISIFERVSGVLIFESGFESPPPAAP